MESYYRRIFAMGTRLELLFPGVDDEQGEWLFELIAGEIRRLEDLMSFYDPESELSRINNCAKNVPFLLSGEMHHILETAFSFHARLSGFFDISMTPLILFLKEKGPDAVVPDEIRESCGMNGLHLDDDTVVKKKEGMQLDLGGFGKGYAMEKVKNMLVKNGISSAFISFGESSVYGHGSHPYGDSWKLQIGHPSDGQKEGIGIELKDSALSVSGNSRNNERKYGDMGHIIDPRDGRMISGPGLVTVTGNSPLVTEVLSTALFSAGKEREKELLNSFPGYLSRRIDP